ncbi:helix-turn-helix domain-containing protein [Tenacibaculum agarivorans]|uniref:helix-turn-helix domain-containing protein n=1 Tax=Tenacibaculum agarivorans TaxID=1908389 RepID=UPI00094BB92C|nr:AraC family transcriptional regulator [Tenacibaculum agarivorans]
MKKLFFTTFLLFNLTVICQTINDDETSLLKLHEFKDTNADSLYHYIKILRASPNKCHHILSYNAEAYHYYTLKEYNLARKNSEKAISLADKYLLDEPENSCIAHEKIDSFSRLFWIYKNLEEYKVAYEYIIKVSNLIDQEQSDSNRIFNKKIGIAFSKAVIKKELNLEEDSKEILLDALKKIATKEVLPNSLLYNNLIARKANIHNLMGENYLALGKKLNNIQFLDSASFYFEKAYKTALKFNPPHKDSELMYHLRKTDVLIVQKKYAEALELINTYKKVCNGANFRVFETLNKAICFHNLNEIDSAIVNASQFLNHKQTKKSKLITAYDILSNDYVIKNQLDSAYKYSKLTLQEFDRAREDKQKTYQLLYDNDLNKAKALNSLIVEKEKNKSFTYIILITLFFCFVLFLLNRFYKRKNHNKEKQVKNIKATIQNEDNLKVSYNLDEDFERKVIEIIENSDKNFEFLKPDFSINSLAKKLDTNSTYLSYVFNKNKQQTFKQYYNNKKLEYIIDRLENDPKYRKFTIQALGEEIGYTNASAFTRAFKKHTGVTPSTFLKELK